MTTFVDHTDIDIHHDNSSTNTVIDEPHASENYKKPIGVVQMEEVVQSIQQAMKTRLNMEEVVVNNPDLCCKCSTSSIFVSRNYSNCSRLLVIVPYREAGIWSRSMCLIGEDSSGSMIEYLKKAGSEDYGILIMNPAAKGCHPKEHVETVWMKHVAPLMLDIFIIAFSRGCQLVKHLLNFDSGEGIIEDQLRALAFVEPSHTIDPSDSYFSRRILSQRAVAWAMSSEILGGDRIRSIEGKLGCVCVSAGPVPANVNSSTGGLALQQVMTSVFASFAARYGKGSGITRFDSKLTRCSLCQRKLGLLNRKIQCGWCEVKVCSNCVSDMFIKSYGMEMMCRLCQLMPCLIDPREKYRKEKRKEQKLDQIERDSIFIQPENTDSLSLRDFEIVKLIGKGACGRVKLVRKRSGVDEGILYAMKAIRKKLVVQKGLVEATNAERRILDIIDHPYITKLYYAFQTVGKLYLLTKYYPGGNLLDQMRKVRRFGEDRARLYAAQVAMALGHLHSKGIMYRDLKLENVLCDHEGHIALTDFGMSKENVFGNGRAKTFVGTYQMMAPDILKGKPYTKSVDWWALGIMVYEMIEGRTPFNGKTNGIIKQRILNGEIRFSNRFSMLAKEFVASLLMRKPEDRLGSGESGFNAVKNHAWFNGINWDDLYNRKVLFKNQSSLMKLHAKEFNTNDILENYMNTMELAVDTPSSIKSHSNDLFDGFSYNYMDENISEEEITQNDHPEFDLSQLRPDMTLDDDMTVSIKNETVPGFDVVLPDKTANLIADSNFKPLAIQGDMIVLNQEA